MDMKAFFAEHDIDYEWFDHPAVFTCEESEQLPDMPGADTKNLFLKEQKGERRFLVVVGHEKRADLKSLRALLEAKSLTFGDAESMQNYLGVTPGSVTLLGILHDTDRAIEVVIDQDIWDADSVRCHPLINTASVVIPHADIEKFLSITGHEAKVFDVPARPEE